jgi:hypothetical protein
MQIEWIVENHGIEWQHTYILINEIEGFDQYSFPRTVHLRNLFYKLEQKEDVSMYIFILSLNTKENILQNILWYIRKEMV